VNKDLESDFLTPGSRFRGQPFWAWNAALEPAELARQIRLMKRMGLGGFFMHSRVGLDTPYLKDEWFRCVNACADEAKRQDMIAWMYDEDRWPSGAAGGLVTKDLRYRRRSLSLSEAGSPASLKWTADTVAAFTARVDGTRATSVRRIPKGKKPSVLAKGESLLVMSVVLEQPSSWYNDATYLDTLSPAAVRRFIAVTHDAYKDKVRASFGKSVPGMFTDEPNHGHKFENDNNTGAAMDIPWTGILPGAFKERYGYDLLPHLVELFYDVDGQEMTPARHDYHDCVTALFVGSFAQQIGEWCEQNGLMHIGHVLMEDRLSDQADVVGSAMRFYEHMQAPGMDLLTERWRCYTTAKQVSSVAHQFGRTWRLTETYGCTGWDFSFAGHKALGDWQVALGITLRCQHLAWYRMGGEAKRDYPAAISPQSPWWELYPVVEDYFARLHAVMTRGEEVRDILVVHPVESTWSMIRRGWKKDERVRAFDRGLVDLEDTLLGQHLDFDYGDEEMLARLAAVSRRSGAAVLLVGKALYAAVIVPPLLTIRASTLKLLEEFRAAGGAVIFAGTPARYVDSVFSPSAADLAARCLAAPPAGAGLADAVAARGRRVSIADASGVEIPAALALLREDKDAWYLFVCNTGLSGADLGRDIFDCPPVRERTLAFPAVTVKAWVTAAGTPRELDPRTGGERGARARRGHGGEWEIATSLPALGSRLFLFPKAADAAAVSAPLPDLAEVRRAALSEPAWSVARTEDNVLVLDRPWYRVGTETWQGPEEVLRVDRAVRTAAGLAPRGGQMVQPWARKAARASKKVALELRYVFTVSAAVSGAVSLALENPELWSVAVNGVPLPADADCGWWVDPSLRRLPFSPSLLRAGENEVLLSGRYDAEHPGLEIIYLLGDFGVKVQGTAVTVGEAPRTITLGDWTGQGLPFYAGSLCYNRTVDLERAADERLFVQVPAFRGTAVRVMVDGRPAGVIPWEPNEVEITNLVGAGRSSHEIRIEVIGHRRNSHGPLHHAQQWPPWTGPAQFVTTGAEWNEGYTLVPCGLMEPPAVVVRRAVT
jgi:hypothetical protein